MAVAVCFLLFGCIGGSQSTGATYDGDFKSLVVRGGPTTLLGTLNVTGNVTLTGNVSLPSTLNLSSLTSNLAFTGNNNFTGANNFSGNNAFGKNNSFSGNNNFTGNNAFSGVNTHSGTEAFTGTVNLTGATVSSATKVTAGSGTFVNNTSSVSFALGRTYLTAPTVVISEAGAVVPSTVTFYVSGVNTTTVNITSSATVTGGNVTLNFVAVGPT